MKLILVGKKIVQIREASVGHIISRTSCGHIISNISENFSQTSHIEWTICAYLACHKHIRIIYLWFLPFIVWFITCTFNIVIFQTFNIYPKDSLFVIQKKRITLLCSLKDFHNGSTCARILLWSCARILFFILWLYKNSKKSRPQDFFRFDILTCKWYSVSIRKITLTIKRILATLHMLYFVWISAVSVLRSIPYREIHW